MVRGSKVGKWFGNSKWSPILLITVVVIVAYAFAWCRGRSAGIKHEAVKQTEAAIEKVNVDEKVELEKSEDVATSGDNAAMRRYSLELAERLRKEARSH